MPTTKHTVRTWELIKFNKHATTGTLVTVSQCNHWPAELMWSYIKTDWNYRDGVSHLSAQRELRASPRKPNVETSSRSLKSRSFEVLCLAPIGTKNRHFITWICEIYVQYLPKNTRTKSPTIVHQKYNPFTHGLYTG